MVEEQLILIVMLELGKYCECDYEGGNVTSIAYFIHRVLWALVRDTNAIRKPQIKMSVARGHKAPLLIYTSNMIVFTIHGKCIPP
jgi:hypothetical protein